jgi:hypothetical protein
MWPFVTCAIVWVFIRVTLCVLNGCDPFIIEMKEEQIKLACLRHSVDILTAFFLGCLCQYAHWAMH